MHAADIDDDRRAASDVDAIACREVNEPRLFTPGDDAHAYTGLPAYFGNEVAAILGFFRYMRWL